MSNLLFDIKDPHAMTFPKNVSAKWSKSTVAMADTTKFGVVTVYDNKYAAKEVLAESKFAVHAMIPRIIHGSWAPVTHCEWCGQKLDYVAVIVGIDNKTKDAMVHHIGCDCVGKIFGVRWFGYRDASEAKRKLVESAKARSRKEKYAVEYVKYIMWMLSIPPDVMERTHFLKDMYEILTTGCKVFTKGMETVVVRMMADPKFTKVGAEKLKVQTTDIVNRIDLLLKLIASVDGDGQSGTKSFVTSVRSNVEKWGKLTEGQKNALNKVHVRYTERKTALEAKKQLKTDLGLSNATLVVPSNPTDEIPW
jgi:hypothetical protein